MKNFFQKLKHIHLIHLELGIQNYLLDGLLISSQFYLLGLLIYEYNFRSHNENISLSLGVTALGCFLSIASTITMRFKCTLSCSIIFRLLVLPLLLVAFIIEKIYLVTKEEEISAHLIRHEEFCIFAILLSSYACLHRIFKEFAFFSYIVILYIIWASFIFWEIKEYKKFPMEFLIILLFPFVIFSMLTVLKWKEEANDSLNPKIMKKMLFMSSVGMVLLRKTEKIIFATPAMNQILLVDSNCTENVLLTRIKRLSLLSYKKIGNAKLLSDWRGPKGSMARMQPSAIGTKLDDVINIISRERAEKINQSLQMVYYAKISKKNEKSKIDQEFHDRLILTTNECTDENPAEGDEEEAEEVRHYEIKISIIDKDDDKNELYLLHFNDITDAQTIKENDLENEFKINMLNSFSHELKTPLNISRSILECAIDDEAVPTSVKEKYLSHPISSLKLLTFLIQDIIDFLKLETGQLEIDIENFSVRGLINEIVNSLLSARTKEKRIELMIGDMSALRGYNITTDKNRLRRILLNLIQNSIKYTERGSITISARMHQKGPNIALEIQDSRFIEHKKRREGDKLLATSTRQKKARKEFSLMISQMMLQALSLHGIEGPEFESRPDGLLCKIIFPGSQYGLHSINLTSDIRMGSSVEEVSKARKPFGSRINHSKLIEISQRDAKKPRECPKVLLVDDDPFNLVSLEMLLLKQGIVSIKADDGLKAVNTLVNFFSNHNSCPPSCKGISCVFMDLRMPVMDGIESCRKINELVAKGTIPKVLIIACSANDSKDDIIACKEVGMLNFISKPLSKQILEGTIKVCETELGFKLGE